MPEQEPVDFNLKAYAPLLATVYGEAGGEPREDKIEVISSILNRAESGKAEFGAESGKLTDVLQSGYYAYSQKSPKYLEAVNQKFPDQPSEDSYKEIVALFSSMMKGNIKRSGSVFFLTPKEVEQQRKMYKESKGKKGMNMDLLEKTYVGRKHTYFTYKKHKATEELAQKVQKSSSGEGSFKDAFAKAKKGGANKFTWRGKSYTTETK